MSLSSRAQLGCSALIERGKLISNRAVVAVLASCVQTRARRGSLPPFPGAKHSPHLRAALFGYVGSTGSNALHIVQQAEPQIGQTQYQTLQ